MECKNGMFDMRKRMRGNAPLSTGKYDETFDNLSTGNFDPREEMRKLDVLNRNLSRQQQAQEKIKLLSWYWFYGLKKKEDRT